MKRKKGRKWRGKVEREREKFVRSLTSSSEAVSSSALCCSYFRREKKKWKQEQNAYDLSVKGMN